MLSKEKYSAIMNLLRRISQISHLKTVTLNNCPSYIQLSETYFHKDKEKAALELINNMTVYQNFLSETEEKSILDEIEPYLARLRYEFAHWDDAIHGYRETERLKWNDGNTLLLNRVRELAFPPTVAQLKHVHILDLDKTGYIKPHIDAIRFCGDTIAGLSLLSDSVMRLIHEENKSLVANVFLKKRSLYIMKGTVRFNYTHEILKDEDSLFAGTRVPRDRRISVICRNEPDTDNTTL